MGNLRDFPSSIIAIWAAEGKTEIATEITAYCVASSPSIMKLHLLMLM